MTDCKLVTFLLPEMADLLYSKWNRAAIDSTTLPISFCTLSHYLCRDLETDWRPRAAPPRLKGLSIFQDFNAFKPGIRSCHPLRTCRAHTPTQYAHIHSWLQKSTFPVSTGWIVPLSVSHHENPGAGINSDRGWQWSGVGRGVGNDDCRTIGTKHTDFCVSLSCHQCCWHCLHFSCSSWTHHHGAMTTHASTFTLSNLLLFWDA